MKKIFFLITILISYNLYGQSTKKTTVEKLKTKLFINEIWSEDFVNGIPDSWTVIDSTGNNFIWKHSLVGPRGAYIATTWNEPNPTLIIQSPSKENGFIILESDWYNTDQNGEIINPPIEMNSSIITSAIDCSAKSLVILSFYEYYRLCCTSNTKLSVFVSNNGYDWIEFDAKQPGASIANPSTNAYRAEIDITSIAANQPTVYLKFQQRIASHYHWQIDDIVLSDELSSSISSNQINNYNLGDIYPNPTNNQITIPFMLSKSNVVYFEIYNPIGQLIYSNEKTVNSGNQQEVINIENLPNGLYNLKINIDNKNYAKQFSKIN